MSSLKEFLAERGEAIQAEAKLAYENREEWAEAVKRLYADMRAWLQEADPDGFLHMQEEEFTLNERSLGEYRIQRMIIRLGARKVRVEPVARYVAGPYSTVSGIHIRQAYGRVEMSDGSLKFILLRVSKEPKDHWSIIGQGDNQLRDLDQSTFEDALKCLLD